MSDRTFQERLDEAHEFPGAFSFKLIGEATTTFTERVVAAAAAIVPDSEPALSSKVTRSGRHQSITLTLRVPDSDAVVALYDAFSNVEGLKVML